MRIVVVVGVRPQFVKLGALLPTMECRHEVTLVHTGQHWDEALSSDIFSNVGLRKPDVSLSIHEPSRVRRLAASLMALAPLLEQAQNPPDLVLVLGDSDPALAGAAAGAATGIPVAHCEAGLRNTDTRLIEELNRRSIDGVAQLHFAPNMRCLQNLAQEGHPHAKMTGDLHLDAVRAALPRVDTLRPLCTAFGLTPGDYFLLTFHRPENMLPGRLYHLLSTLNHLGSPTLWCQHPRSRVALDVAGLKADLEGSSRIVPIGPQRYVDLLALISDSRGVLTDSGGLQREAYFLGKQCMVLRDSVEFPETLTDGWGALASPVRDVSGLADRLFATIPATAPNLSMFGGGHAAELVCASLDQYIATDKSILLPSHESVDTGHRR